MPNSDQQALPTGNAAKVLRVVILVIFSLVLAIVSVSFAVHHMRIGFEREYRSIMETRVTTAAENASLMINGDDIVNDPANAAAKYASVLNLLLSDTNDEDYATQAFGLYAYTNGSLSMLVESDSDMLISGDVAVSDWLTKDLTPYIISDQYEIHYLVPITDSTGKAVGLLEISGNSEEIVSLGNTVESRVLSSVIVAVLCGMVLFALQYAISPLLGLITKTGKEGKV
ncbi:MAG TPA: hypothetical protein PKV44_05615 [Bacillota bacterium]|nr:hypothetical protein [Bacillota bacterium]HPE38719.1 hypothetical protein [Bacillota bacterium]